MEQLDNENIKLKLSKDPEIIEGAKDVSIALMNQSIQRLRASRDELRENNDELKTKCERLESELAELRKLAGDKNG